jgi:biotin carboxylase
VAFSHQNFGQKFGGSKRFRSNQQTSLGQIRNQNGATHSEYIRGTDGRYYFLETSSRVGGAHIPDMVEAATGVNIWREWANWKMRY